MVKNQSLCSVATATLRVHVTAGEVQSSTAGVVLV